MNDLQKDQAIYQAMCKIADKYFNRAVEENEAFREFMAEKSIISLAELKKCKEWSNALYGYYDYSKHEQVKGIDFDVESIDVDTYHCEFRGDTLFSHALLEQFKSLAKNRCDLYFTYEEKPRGVCLGSLSVGFSNVKGAKTLIEHCADDELRPVMNHVLMEVNTVDQSINFVASDGHSLAIVSNMPGNWTNTCDYSKCLQVLIPKSEWKRLCDYALKSKTEIVFDVYLYDNPYTQERFCTMVAHIGDATIKFTDRDMRYPNWRSVLPDIDAMRRYDIHPEDIKALRSWLKTIGKEKYGQCINVSVYRGSDLVYFEYEDYDFSKSHTATFRLTRPSQVTEGIAYSRERLSKTLFSGFCISKSDRASVLIPDNYDYLLIMPMLRESYVTDVENREVLEAVEEAAMVVELAA